MKYDRHEGDRTLSLRFTLVAVLIGAFLVGAILYLVWPK
jgi:hypothetical protein